MQIPTVHGHWHLVAIFFRLCDEAELVFLKGQMFCLVLQTQFHRSTNSQGRKVRQNVRNDVRLIRTSQRSMMFGAHLTVRLRQRLFRGGLVAHLRANGKYPDTETIAEYPRLSPI